MPTLAQFTRAMQTSRHMKEYKKGMVIQGGGKMGLQGKYSYTLTESPGKHFDPRFTPYATPAEMLSMGVFEGKYLNDCLDEFPYEWFRDAHKAGKLAFGQPDIECNLFQVQSRQPLSVWVENGWAPSNRRARSTSPKRTRDMLADPKRNPDERGWFQWYCRYWLGRRIPDLDSIQIGRWRSFARHVGAIRKGCAPHDTECRKRERQALLQWAYDPFV